MSGPGPWVLAIDVGSCFTAAACWHPGGHAEVLELDGAARIPSAVFVTDDGALVGNVADELAASDPARVLPGGAIRRRLGDPTPVVLDGRPHDAKELVGAVLRRVFAEALGHHDSAPTEVRLTYPAAWSPRRQDALIGAAAAAQLPNEPTLVAEPVGAAIGAGAEPGARVLVYDLGGGSFDAAALEATPGGPVVVGHPINDPSLGAELLDELLANHVGGRLDPDVWSQLQGSDEPDWRHAAAGLCRETHRAREALSSQPWAEVRIPLVHGRADLRIARAELEGLARPALVRSVEALEWVAEGAGFGSGEVATVCLVGGGSRMPLVADLVSTAFPGATIDTPDDPKGVVALGAARPNAAPTRRRSSVAPPASAIPGPGPGPGPAPAPTSTESGDRFTSVRPGKRQRIVAWVGVAAVVAAAVAGGGVILANWGGDPGPDRPAGSATSATSPTSTTTPVTAGGDLDDGLLTLEDLAHRSSYVDSPVETGPLRPVGDRLPCGSSTIVPDDVAIATFRDDTAGVHVLHEVRSYPDEQRAIDAVDQAMTLVANCSGESISFGDVSYEATAEVVPAADSALPLERLPACDTFGVMEIGLRPTGPIPAPPDSLADVPSLFVEAYMMRCGTVEVLVQLTMTDTEVVDPDDFDAAVLALQRSGEELG